MYKLYFLFFLSLFFSCQSTNNSGNTSKQENPAAAGFMEAESDPQAIQIADKVMQAMGGRTAWDAVDTLAWNFFGIRDIWERKTRRKISPPINWN